MSGYVPPALRHKVNYKPKDLKFKPKIIWTEPKSKEQVMREYMMTNYGKADAAWGD
jgi:hypothetical protein